MQTIVAARRLCDVRSVFIGVDRPSTAAILASMVHNPDLVLVYESGTIGAKPYRVPLSIGDGELAATADAVVSVPEMFNHWIRSDTAGVRDRGSTSGFAAPARPRSSPIWGGSSQTPRPRS